AKPSRPSARAMRARSSWRSHELRRPARSRARAVQAARRLQAPQPPRRAASRTHQDGRARRGRDSLVQQLSGTLQRAGGGRRRQARPGPVRGRNRLRALHLRHLRHSPRARTGARTVRGVRVGPQLRELLEGDIAKLPDIATLARRYGAVVAMDDSHGTGVLGRSGRGTAEHYRMLGQVDIITSTLGKALGGAAGGFTAGPSPLADYLTQRSRPQLFSNALPPTVAGSALAAVRHVEHHPELVTRLHENARYFRERLRALGFKPLDGETPIVPVILGETAKAIEMSELLLDEGVFVTGF